MCLVLASQTLSSVAYFTNRYYVLTAVVVGVEAVHSMDTTTGVWSTRSITPRYVSDPFGSFMVAVADHLYVVGFRDTTEAFLDVRIIFDWNSVSMVCWHF